VDFNSGSKQGKRNLNEPVGIGFRDKNDTYSTMQSAKKNNKQIGKKVKTLQMSPRSLATAGGNSNL